MAWQLDQRVKTSVGTIAAGCSGNGPALVLAHGWPWSSYSWHRIIPRLAENYRVYWYDMIGYGQSDMIPEQRSALDVQGDVFVEMMQHWGIENPTVVAHDFGGATTLRAHLLGGFDFNRLILMNVVAVRPWGSDFFEHVGRHVDAFTGLPAHIHEAVVRAYIGGALVQPLTSSDIDALVQPWLSDMGRSSFYRQFAQADERLTAEIEPFFGSIRCPVHIVWGDQDPWIPIGRGKQLHSAIGDASFDTLEGAGHLPQLEVPERVLNALSKII